MTKIYFLDPEVAGGFGERTEMDRSIHPPFVSRLHYVFDGWLGDQLIQSFPCFLISDSLAEEMLAAGVTGFIANEAEVETSEQFRDFYPDRSLPVFKWLHIDGLPGRDDIYLSSDFLLAANQKAFDLIAATQPRALRIVREEIA